MDLAAGRPDDAGSVFSLKRAASVQDMTMRKAGAPSWDGAAAAAEKATVRRLDPQRRQKP
jgi:hypothetical protein